MRGGIRSLAHHLLPDPPVVMVIPVCRLHIRMAKVQSDHGQIHATIQHEHRRGVPQIVRGDVAIGAYLRGLADRGLTSDTPIIFAAPV